VRAAYLHAHSAVHGFPRHLAALPSSPPASIAPHTLQQYLPVPRVFPAPFMLSAFPASASLSLTQARSLRLSEKAAKREAQREADARNRKDATPISAMPGRRVGRVPHASSIGNTSAGGNGGIGPGGSPSYSPPAGPPPGFDFAAIWPWSWEQHCERERASAVQALKALRCARKKNRDDRRDGIEKHFGAVGPRGVRGAYYAPHPSFATSVSLYSAHSTRAKIRYDEDTLSPYFASAPYMRKGALGGTIRSSSPIHGRCRSHTSLGMHVACIRASCCALVRMLPLTLAARFVRSSLRRCPLSPSQCCAPCRPLSSRAATIQRMIPTAPMMSRLSFHCI
jgi:hypothetical protein